MKASLDVKELRVNVLLRIRASYLAVPAEKSESILKLLSILGHSRCCPFLTFMLIVIMGCVMEFIALFSQQGVGYQSSHTFPLLWKFKANML